MSVEPKIYTTAEWGARPPKKPIVMAGKPHLAVVHHTDWHADNLDGNPTESLDEAMRLARAIQDDHMDHRGWNDSGHNFLVTRSGHIFEGRHGSLAAIRAGRMVVSAHAVAGKNPHLKPGANEQPGVEHEQKGSEGMTDEQKAASVALFAFICRSTGIKASELYPHKKFSDTDCPGAIEPFITELQSRVADELATSNGSTDGSIDVLQMWFDWAQWRLGRGPFRGHKADPLLRPKTAPTRIPQAWWDALKKVGG